MSKKIITTINFLTFLLLILSLFTLPVLAQEAYTPLMPIDGVNTEATASGDFGAYAQSFFTLLLGVTAVIAVVKIVIGGIEYMTTEAISGKSDAKDVIIQALYGLLLAMAAWIILYTINPQILQFDISDAPKAGITEGVPTDEVQVNRAGDRTMTDEQ